MVILVGVDISGNIGDDSPPATSDVIGSGDIGCGDIG